MFVFFSQILPIFLLSSLPILARVAFLKKRYVLYIIFAQPAWTEITFPIFYF